MKHGSGWELESARRRRSAVPLILLLVMITTAAGLWWAWNTGWWPGRLHTADGAGHVPQDVAPTHGTEAAQAAEVAQQSEAPVEPETSGRQEVPTPPDNESSPEPVPGRAERASAAATTTSRWRPATDPERTAVQRFLEASTDDAADPTGVSSGDALGELRAGRLERRHTGLRVEGTLRLSSPLMIADSDGPRAQALGCVDTSGIRMLDGDGGTLPSTPSATMHRFDLEGTGPAVTVSAHSPDAGEPRPAPPITCEQNNTQSTERATGP
jgi:hypothetical protein